MNPRERALRTIYLEETDIVPWFDTIDCRVLAGIFGKRMLHEDLEDRAKAYLKLGIDFLSCGLIF